jgi:hypothetical protein
MVTRKKLGIWMNHSSTLLMELSINSIKDNKIARKFSHIKKVYSFNNGNNPINNIDQYPQSGLYKRIGDAFRDIYMIKNETVQSDKNDNEISSSFC